MVKMLANDPVVASQLAEQIVTSMRAAGKPMTDEMRKTIVQVLTEQISTHVAEQSIHHITQQAGQSIGDTARTR